jgi:hypothetical protein
VPVGRAERWGERKPRVVEVFGDAPETLRAVEQLFELLELAWHDVYGKITPSEKIIDEVLLCSQGTLSGLIVAARTAVVDRRDLHVWAATLGARPE